MPRQVLHEQRLSNCLPVHPPLASHRAPLRFAKGLDSLALIWRDNTSW